MARNKRHLQQVAKEEGANTGPIMKLLQRKDGLSVRAEHLLDGKFYTEYKVSEEMAAWMKAVKKT